MATIPPPPYSIFLNSVEPTAMMVSWDYVPQADGYFIERQEGDTWIPLELVSNDIFDYGSQPSTIAMGLFPNTNYCFRVSSYNKCGYSEPVSSCQFTTCNVPQRPSGLTAEAVNDTTVYISWNGVGSGVYYILERSIDGSPFTVIFTSEPDETEYTDTVPTDSSVEYRLQATNGCGNSSYVNTTLSTTCTIPKIPSRINAFKQNDDSIIVAWTATNSVTYELERSHEGESWSNVYTGSLLSYTEMPGNSGETYCYRVRGINSCGTGDFTDETCAVINDYVECGSLEQTFSWERKRTGEPGWTPADTEYIRYSPEGSIDVSDPDITDITFLTPDTELDDILVMYKPDEEIVETFPQGRDSETNVAYEVHYQLPNNCVIYIPSSGHFVTKSLTIPTAAKVFTEVGTNHYVRLPHGTEPTPDGFGCPGQEPYGGGCYKDFEKAGFRTVDFRTGISKQELINLGFVDSRGIFKFKFAHVVCGLGHVKIQGMTCFKSGGSSSSSSCIDPTSPSGVTVSEESDGIRLNWNDGINASGVEIWRKVAGTGDELSLYDFVLQGEETYKDFSVSKGLIYCYSIRSSGCAQSDFSSEICQLFNPADPCETPTRPTDFNVSNGYAGIVLNWNEGSGENGTRIERSVNSGPFLTLTSVSAGTSTLTDTSGFSENDSVCYRLVSVGCTESLFTSDVCVVRNTPTCVPYDSCCNPLYVTLDGIYNDTFELSFDCINNIWTGSSAGATIYLGRTDDMSIAGHADASTGSSPWVMRATGFGDVFATESSSTCPPESSWVITRNDPGDVFTANVSCSSETEECCVSYKATFTAGPFAGKNNIILSQIAPNEWLWGDGTSKRDYLHLLIKNSVWTLEGFESGNDCCDDYQFEFSGDAVHTSGNSFVVSLSKTDERIWSGTDSHSGQSWTLIANVVTEKWELQSDDENWKITASLVTHSSCAPAFTAAWTNEGTYGPSSGFILGVSSLNCSPQGEICDFEYSSNTGVGCPPLGYAYELNYNSCLSLSNAYPDISTVPPVNLECHSSTNSSGSCEGCGTMSFSTTSNAYVQFMASSVVSRTGIPVCVEDRLKSYSRSHSFSGDEVINGHGHKAWGAPTPDAGSQKTVELCAGTTYWKTGGISYDCIGNEFHPYAFMANADDGNSDYDWVIEVARDLGGSVESVSYPSSDIVEWNYTGKIRIRPMTPDGNEIIYDGTSRIIISYNSDNTDTPCGAPSTDSCPSDVSECCETYGIELSGGTPLDGAYKLKKQPNGTWSTLDPLGFGPSPSGCSEQFAVMHCDSTSDQWSITLGDGACGQTTFTATSSNCPPKLGWSGGTGSLIVTTPECFCDECGDGSCTFCDDCTPPTFLVDLSGVELSSDVCLNCGLSSWIVEIISGSEWKNFNNTYRLIKKSACVWETVIPAKFNLLEGSGDCSSMGSNITDLKIRLTKTSTEMKLDVFDSNAVYFTGQLAGNKCGETSIIYASNTEFECLTFEGTVKPHLGKNGQAVIEPCQSSCNGICSKISVTVSGTSSHDDIYILEKFSSDTCRWWGTDGTCALSGMFVQKDMDTGEEFFILEIVNCLTGCAMTFIAPFDGSSIPSSGWSIFSESVITNQGALGGSTGSQLCGNSQTFSTSVSVSCISV